jgi:hypothetical protein
VRDLEPHSKGSTSVKGVSQSGAEDIFVPESEEVTEGSIEFKNM